MYTNTAIEATDEITEASNDAAGGLVEVTEHGELVAPGAFVKPGTIVEQLHGDLDDPTDGPLDQAALRRHRDAVDLVRQDTQDHCMACGHKGEVAS